MIQVLNKIELQLLVIILLTILAYSNILHNGFVGDDVSIIRDWELVHNLENLPKIWAGETQPEPHTGYRPLRSTYIAFEYYFFRDNTIFYHVISIISHIISTLLIYFIVLHISKKKVMAFITALIFGLHPVHTENVSEIIASIDSIGYIFFLSAFLLYIKSFEIVKKKIILKRKYYLSSVFISLISFFSYEPTLSLILMIIFYDFLFRRMPDFKSYLKIYAPFLIMVLIYLSVRVGIAHTLEGSGYITGSFYKTQLLMLKVWLLYFTLLIFPIDLGINHLIDTGVYVWVDPFTNLETIRALSLFDPKIILSILIIIILVVAGYKNYKKNPLITFGIGWFFISLAPMSYIIPQDAFMQDRYLYLGVFGLGLITASIYEFFFKKRKYFLLINLFLIGILIFYFVRTYIRNFDWENDLHMHEVMAKQVPQNVMTNFTLATLYMDDNQNDKALEYFVKTLNLAPTSANVYYYLAQIYREKGDFEKASLNINQSLDLYKHTQEEFKKEPKKENNKLIEDIKRGIKENNGFGNWKIESLDKGIILFYPTDWVFYSLGSKFVISISTGNSTVEMEIEEITPESSFQEYISSQPKLYMSLVQEGSVQASNYSEGYLKIWQNKEEKIYQFFLLRNNIILKFLVNSATEENLEVFNQIASRILMREDEGK